MSARWDDRRTEPRPESPGRRAADTAPVLDREPDENYRIPWTAHKRAHIRWVRAEARRSA